VRLGLGDWGIGVGEIGKGGGGREEEGARWGLAGWLVVCGVCVEGWGVVGQQPHTAARVGGPIDSV
jgi:hypothetical protein